MSNRRWGNPVSGLYASDDEIDEREDDRWRAPISKSSGKESAYVIFLKQRGRHIFRSLYGYEYQPRSEADKQKMSDIYQKEPPERLAEYKRIANSDHNSKENCERRRHEAERRRRERAHANPKVYDQVRRQHRNIVGLNQERDRNRLGPVRVPKPDSVWEPNTALEQDFLVKQDEDTRVLFDRFQFIENLRRAAIARGDLSNSCKGMLDRKFQFIGVLPFCAVLADAKPFVYPSELAIVSFTLRDGVLDWQCCSINFTADVFFPDVSIGTSPEILALRETIENQASQNARQYGLSLISPTGLWAPDAWEWVRERVDINAVLCCEENQFNFVYPALKTCAYDTKNMEEQAYFQEHILHKVFTLKSIAAALCAVSKKTVSNQEIADFFLSPRVAEDKYCEVHGRLQLDNISRNSCQMAFAARKIELLYEFARKEDLVDMRSVYNDEHHKFCTEVVGTYAELPSHPILPSEMVHDESGLYAVLVNSSDEEDVELRDPEAFYQRINHLRVSDHTGPRGPPRPLASSTPMPQARQREQAQDPETSFSRPRPSSAVPPSVPFAASQPPPAPQLGASRATGNNRPAPTRQTVPQPPREPAPNGQNGMPRPQLGASRLARNSKGQPSANRVSPNHDERPQTSAGKKPVAHVFFEWRIMSKEAWDALE